MRTTKKITFIALAITTLLIFAQCGSKPACQAAAEPAATAECHAPAVKIVYVDLDSLMSNYDFAKDINKAMMRKEEDIKMKLTDKYKALQADQADFERKYKNNVYATPERAQEASYVSCIAGGFFATEPLGRPLPGNAPPFFVDFYHPGDM